MLVALIEAEGVGMYESEKLNEARYFLSRMSKRQTSLMLSGTNSAPFFRRRGISSNHWKCFEYVQKGETI